MQAIIEYKYGQLGEQFYIFLEFRFFKMSIFGKHTKMGRNKCGYKVSAQRLQKSFR